MQASTKSNKLKAKGESASHVINEHESPFDQIDLMSAFKLLTGTTRAEA